MYSTLLDAWRLVVVVVVVVRRHGAVDSVGAAEDDTAVAATMEHPHYVVQHDYAHDAAPLPWHNRRVVQELTQAPVSVVLLLLPATDQNRPLPRGGVVKVFEVAVPLATEPRREN